MFSFVYAVSAIWGGLWRESRGFDLLIFWKEEMHEAAELKLFVWLNPTLPTSCKDTVIPFIFLSAADSPLFLSWRIRDSSSDILPCNLFKGTSGLVMYPQLLLCKTTALKSWQKLIIIFLKPMFCQTLIVIKFPL